MNPQTSPKYPVYIISKGRWESRLTSKALEKADIPYHIVVEPQEYDNYAAVISPEKIHALPFSNLGQGSIPVRNWVWEHSISLGAERHWILDDNIEGFRMLYQNKKIMVYSGAPLRATEDFVDRYENVAMAGLEYDYFLSAFDKHKPFRLNTRVYSCILLKNDLPFRWRGRYNEDTDLSLRILKDGWCTVLMQIFMCNKVPTLTMKGGNMDELYKGDGRYEMAKSLWEQHPDVVKVTRLFGRWQHKVDYRPFKNNRLVKKQGAVVPEGDNNYGLVLEKVPMEPTKSKPIIIKTEPATQFGIVGVAPDIEVKVPAGSSSTKKKKKESFVGGLCTKCGGSGKIYPAQTICEPCKGTGEVQSF